MYIYYILLNKNKLTFISNDASVARFLYCPDVFNFCKTKTKNNVVNIISFNKKLYLHIVIL